MSSSLLTTSFQSFFFFFKPVHYLPPWCFSRQKWCSLTSGLHCLFFSLINVHPDPLCRCSPVGLLPRKRYIHINLTNTGSYALCVKQTVANRISFSHFKQHISPPLIMICIQSALDLISLSPSNSVSSRLNIHYWGILVIPFIKWRIFAGK